MNATEHSATGCAPASIIYGSAIYLNQELFPPINERLQHVNQTPLRNYLSKAMQIQQTIIDIALNNQIDTNRKHLQRKETSKSQPYYFKEGMYVIYDEPNTFQQTDARPDKLSPHYKGPYQILDVNTQRANIR